MTAGKPRLMILEFVTAGGVQRHSRDFGGPPPPSLVREGAAMVAAIRFDAGAICDAVVIAEPSGDPGPAALMDRWLQQYFDNRCDAVLIIAPEIGGHLVNTVVHFRKRGANVLSLDDRWLEVFSDKCQTAQFLAQHGLPHPQTFARGIQPPATAAWVVKPIDGCGSMGVRRFRGETLGSKEFAQRLICGRSVSQSVVGNGQTDQILPAVTQQIDGKTFAYTGGRGPLDHADSARCIAVLEPVLAVLPIIRGWVGFDMILADDPGDDCVIEINPRVTTSIVGIRQMVSFNLVAPMFGLDSGESSHRSIAAADWQLS